MTKSIKTPSAAVMVYFNPTKPEYTHLMKQVNKIAGSYSRKSPLSFDDLQSIGLEGAWTAAIRYDEKVKAKFMTFAYTYISGYIKNEVKAGINSQNTDTSLEQRLEAGIDDSVTDLSSALEANVELEDALACLTEREKFVLIKRAEGYTLKEVGKMLAKDGQKSLSHVYVRKLEGQARKILLENS